MSPELTGTKTGDADILCIWLAVPIYEKLVDTESVEATPFFVIRKPHKSTPVELCKTPPETSI